MTEPPSALPTASMPSNVLDPMFVWIELNRRLDSLSGKYERLDEHGSRGVEALRTEVRQMTASLNEHERQHAERDAEQRAGRRATIGVLVAVVVPLYPLLGWLLTHAGR